MDDLVSGGSYPLPVFNPPRSLEGGWDSRCYLLAPIPPPVQTPDVADVRQCDWQKRFADITNRLYAGDGSTARDKLLEFFPDAVTTLYSNNASSTPGCLTAIVGSLTMVFISGTTNPTQWALQGLTGVAGPVNFGNHSTLLLWGTVGFILQERIRLTNPDPAGRVVFVGHSYGGALACVLAFRYRQFAPTRSIHLLTFGCPKPGDQRLIDGIRTTIERHLVNEDDPVSFLPPSGADFGIFAWVIPSLVAARWSGWARARFFTQLSTTGVRTDSPNVEDFYALALRILFNAIIGEPIQAITSHLMPEYLRRIQCPPDPAPSPTPENGPWIWFQPADLVELVTPDAVEFWADSGLAEDNAGRPADDNAVTFDDTGAFDRSILTGNSGYLSLETTYDTLGDYMIFFVMESATALGGPLKVMAFHSNTVGHGVPAIDGGHFYFQTTTGSVLLHTHGGIDGANMFALRVVGNQCWTWRNDVRLGPFTLPAGRRCTIDSWGAVWTTTAISHFARLAEGIIFDGLVSVETESYWADYLLGKYSLPRDALLLGPGDPLLLGPGDPLYLR